jgi:hypothetical protein
VDIDKLVEGFFQTGMVKSTCMFYATNHQNVTKKTTMVEEYIDCRNPNLAKCGGEAQHLEKLGFGVHRDSRMFRARQQGEKNLSLGCSWCRWKGLET